MTEYADDVKRLKDTISLHLETDYEQAVNSWVAVRLSDGSTDGLLYDSRADAINHQLNEHLCFYITIPPTGIGFKEAEAVLRVNRQLASQGMRLADPDREVVPSTRMETIPRDFSGIKAKSPAEIQGMIDQIEPILPLMSREDRRWFERRITKLKGYLSGRL